MNSPIKAVTFDAAGTLFDVAEPVGTTYSRIARNHRLAADPEALDQGFRSLWNRVPPPHGIASANPPEIDGEETERRWWRNFVEKVFSKACGNAPSLTENEFDALFDDLFEHYAHPEAWRLRPGVPAVLKSVHAQVKTGIISNFDHRFHAIAHGLGLEPCFDSVILSAMAGASKPDSAIFSAAARELDAAPAEILHIGDDPVRDWQGAIDAGFQVYRLDSNANPLEKVPAWIASRL